jgi:N-acetylneuraminate synthase
VSVAACALGASLVEKHVIDAREPATADSAFSLLPDELTRLVEETRMAHAAIGHVSTVPASASARACNIGARFMRSPTSRPAPSLRAATCARSGRAWG